MREMPTQDHQKVQRTLIVAGLIAGLTLSIGVATGSAPAPAVEVGTCFDYKSNSTNDQVASTPATDCAGGHTAQTFWSGTLPATFGVPAKASIAAKLKSTRSCTTARINQFIGLGNRTIPSRFQTVTVFPTTAQWNAGERWVRCDVILRAGKAYKKFTGPIADLVAATAADQFNFCTPGVPGNRTSVAYPCTKPKKNWIMIYENDLGTRNSRFPGARSVESKTKNICQKAAKPFVSQKTFYPWWAIWPREAGWQRGVRTAQCFVPYSEFLKTSGRRT